MESDCEVGTIIHDVGCQLTGKKCGNNKIFDVISSIVHDETYVMNCMQRCNCINSDFVEKNSDCEKKSTTDYSPTTTSRNTISTAILYVIFFIIIFLSKLTET